MAVEMPEPGPAPRPDPTAGTSYEGDMSKPLPTREGKDESPPAWTTEAKNQAAGSRKSPAPSGTR